MKLLDFYNLKSTHVTISFEIVKSEPAKRKAAKKTNNNKSFSVGSRSDCPSVCPIQPNQMKPKMQYLDLVKISTTYF